MRNWFDDVLANGENDLRFLFCLIPCIVCCVILSVICIFIVKKKKNKKSILKIDEEFILNLQNAYGGLDNISSVEVDNSRLKVTVLDLDLVNLRVLKELSQSGVFVTGNVIKTLYKYDSKTIQAQLLKK